MMRARHHHQLRRAEHFDHSWYLIHGFTKVERFHRLSRAAIDSHTLAEVFLQGTRRVASRRCTNTSA